MGGLIVGGMHIYMKIATPLVISAAMALINLPTDPLFRIYVLGKGESDDPSTLKRPFKTKNAFSDAMAKMEETKKIAEKSAEKKEAKKKSKGNPKKNR